MLDKRIHIGASGAAERSVFDLPVLGTDQPLNPASLSRSTTDYGAVLGDGNRVLSAEQVIKQFVVAGSPSPRSRARMAMSDPMATFAFHLAAASIPTSLDHLRTVAQVVRTAFIPGFAVTSLLRTGHECALVAEGCWIGR